MGRIIFIRGSFIGRSSQKWSLKNLLHLFCSLSSLCVIRSNVEAQSFQFFFAKNELEQASGLFLRQNFLVKIAPHLAFNLHLNVLDNVHENGWMRVFLWVQNEMFRYSLPSSTLFIDYDHSLKLRRSKLVCLINHGLVRNDHSRYLRDAKGAS